jgi:putative FmdB family regulatory protein
MPLYEYECFLCRHRFERIQRVTAEPITTCPECGGSVRRLLGTPALQFKGGGWYITDYGSGRSAGTTSQADGNGEGGSAPEEKKEAADAPSHSGSSGDGSAHSESG